MNDITSIYFVILILFSSIVRTPSQKIADLGTAGCKYVGTIKCDKMSSPVEKLPKTCTSFIYEGIRVGVDNKVLDRLPGGGATLDALIATNIPVMALYGHNDAEALKKFLSYGEDSVKSAAYEIMETLKPYVARHKGLKGIIFDQMEGHRNFQVTGYLINYIDVIRETFPSLAVGMNIDASAPIYFLSDSNAVYWDFQILVDHFDFYVLTISPLNVCQDRYGFVETGTSPVNEDEYNSIWSINKMANYTKNLGIQASKLYYGFQTYGSTDNNDACGKYYPSICSAQMKLDNKHICADTQQSFYDKGSYAKLTGKGFVTTINADDFDSVCKCDSLFPAFNAILAGFSGTRMPSACPLFDRN